MNIRGRLGSGAKDDKAVRILNRIIGWAREGLMIEADPRHAERVIKEMGVSGGLEF